jgi:hypothetical protein
MIPHNYQGWRRCIETDSGITLTRSFAEERLKIMEAGNEPFMQGFIKLYGEAYANQVIYWYQKYLSDMN